MERRLKHWGWGYEDEQPSLDELRSTAPGIVAHLGFGSAEPEAPVPLAQLALPPPRLRPPSALRCDLLDRDHDRALHTYGARTGTSSARSAGEFDAPAGRGRPSRDEADAWRCSTGARRAGAAVIPYGGGHRVVGGVEAGARRRATPASSRSTSTRARPGARGRPRSRGRRGSRRRARAGARGRSSPARLHAAPLPAVVRVLDARRVDRDPLRRPLRDAVHAHRRPRRVDPGADARRRAGSRGGCPARAPGRRPTGCCSAPRARSA